MKSAIDRIVLTAAALIFLSASAFSEGLREGVLRGAAKAAGLSTTQDVLPQISSERSAAGRKLFESKKLSLNQEIACQSCHLDRFGSADGIPNAIGTGGKGEGADRLVHGGDIIPRNVLPLWGRGSKDFDVLFWDGKVEKKNDGSIASQFGTDPPSIDPLVVASLLPMVEIREMVADTDAANAFKNESLDAAKAVYSRIEERVRNDETLSALIAQAYNIEPSKITIKEVAECVADFIRDKFQLRDSKFHRFVFDGASLSTQELKGGLLFYGKARCATCHNGPFFSDLKFHTIPFGQAGFGRNGFGVDYGRFNVTLDPLDRNKFRTPPLYNVLKTAPYSHSGSTYDLAAAIRAHVDPLAVLDTKAMPGPQRVEFYQRLKSWSEEPLHDVYLNDDEIADLVAFLGTLTFEAPN